jgi:hypothetical protein
MCLNSRQREPGTPHTALRSRLARKPSSHFPDSSQCSTGQLLAPCNCPPCAVQVCTAGNSCWPCPRERNWDRRRSPVLQVHRRDLKVTLPWRSKNDRRLTYCHSASRRCRHFPPNSTGCRLRNPTPQWRKECRKRIRYIRIHHCSRFVLPRSHLGRCMLQTGLARKRHRSMSYMIPRRSAPPARMQPNESRDARLPLSNVSTARQTSSSCRLS